MDLLVPQCPHCGRPVTEARTRRPLHEGFHTTPVRCPSCGRSFTPGPDLKWVS